MPTPLPAPERPSEPELREPDKRNRLTTAGGPGGFLGQFEPLSTEGGPGAQPQLVETDQLWHRAGGGGGRTCPCRFWESALSPPSPPTAAAQRPGQRRAGSRRQAGGLPLLVAEKPQVARDWGRLFGARRDSPISLRAADVVITWCIGHLTALAPPDAYTPRWRSWRAQGLPMLPARFKLICQPRTEAHARQLFVLMQSPEIGELVNACDAGREGEWIFRSCLQMAGADKPVSRVWLSAMTDGAMRQAWAQRRPAADFDHLAAAARCRSEADWLVGLNATRAVTLAHRRGGSRELLTVGRVQTPTLAMLVAREEAIEGFVSQPFWRLVAQVATPKGRMRTVWQDARGGERHTRQDSALQLAARLRGAAGVLTAVRHRTTGQPPPPLFDLTALQRRAHRSLGLTAQATLDAAQSLYERHKAIGYPRTDAHHIGSTELPAAVATLHRLGAGDWATPLATARQAVPRGATPGWLSARVVDDSRVGDHPAITPTGEAPREASMSAAERGVYALVVRRFLAAFLPDAQISRSELICVVDGERLVARGTVLVEAGWHAAEPPDPPLPVASRLPDGLAVGMEVTAAEVTVQAGKTEPPPHLGDASLLGAMERAGRQCEDKALKAALADRGLGTPATRAAIIESLVQRELARREGRHLRATPLGRQVVTRVGPMVLGSAELTGAWEARLAEVARGTRAAADFMAEVRGLVAGMVGHFLADTPAERDLPSCPSCQSGRMLRGRRGWGCSRWRLGCSWTVPFAAVPGAHSILSPPPRTPPT